MSRSASSAALAARGGVPGLGVAQESMRELATPQKASGEFRVLALDLASTTGYAIITSNSTLITSGTWKLRTTNTPLPATLDNLDKHLSRIHEQFDVQAIAVEAISPMMAKHTATARILFGLSIQTERWAAEHNISFLQPVSPARIKKHAANLLGHARAVKGKEQTIAAAESLLGRPAQSSDEADAVVLAHWASLNVEVKEGSD